MKNSLHLFLLLALALGSAGAPAALAGSAIPASLTMTSDPGDHIGGGQSYNYTNATGTFGTYPVFGGGDVSFYYNDGTNFWTLSFGAPVHAPLQAGTYNGATLYDDRAETEVGLCVARSGAGSSTLTGSFVVKKIIYGRNGTINSFWATFVQHSGGATPALYGEIQYNIASTAQPVNQAPVAYAGPPQRVSYPGTVQLAGMAGDDALPSGTLSAAWTQSSGPGTVTFSDPTQLQPTVTFPALGTYVLQLTVSDGVLSDTSSVTITMIDTTPQTSLVMTSDPGDFIGRGASYNFDLLSGDFTYSSYVGGVLRVAYNGAGGQGWSLEFATPAGEPFAVGTYNGATREASHAKSEPGLDVSGNGAGSNTVTGSFTVKRAVYGPGNSLVAFWATFVQHSDGAGPALTGEIKLNAGATGTSVNQGPGVYAGPAARVLLTSPLSLAGIAGDDGLPNGSLTTQWSVLSGPGNVTFGDASALETTASFAATGTYVLQLSASDGTLSATSTLNVMVIDPTVNVSLAMWSQAGDNIGQGNSYNYSLLDGDFTVSRGFYQGVIVNFATPGYTHMWTLDFSAPLGAPLAIGDYPGVTGYPSQNFGLPELAVSGDGRGSSIITGSFHVYEITYGADGTVLTFHATFVQHADGAAPALVGEIMYHSTGASMIDHAPVVNAGSNASVILPGTLALAGSATDDGLPSNTLTTTWSVLSGPGPVAFADASALQTTASFTIDGTYVLQLVAFDGAVSTSSQMTVTVADPSRSTSLTMTSDPGDYIGGGASYAYTLSDSTFGVTSETGVDVTINVSRTGSALENWKLEFAPPAASPLAVGAYPVVTRYPSEDSTVAGLDVLGEGRSSSELTGSFNVYEIVRSPIDSSVVAFHASFVLHSEGAIPALRGEIRYHASNRVNLAPVVSAGQNLRATLAQPAPLTGSISDDGLPTPAVTAQWSMLSGPGNAVFAQPTAVKTSVTFSTAGVYVLQLTGSDSVFSSNSSVNVVVTDPTANTMLALSSDAADRLGAGASYYYTPTDGTFSLRQVSPNILELDFSSTSSTSHYSLQFAAPGGGPLRDGTFANASATSPLSGPSASPYFHLDPLTGGSILYSSVFNVKEISFDSTGHVSRFWATFDQHENGAVAGLHGEIRYNALPLTLPVAGVYEGLILDAQRIPHGGVILAATAGGLVTGRVVLGNTSYVVRGALAADGSWQGTVSPPTAGVSVTVYETAEGKLSVTVNTNSLQAGASLDLIQTAVPGRFPRGLAGAYAVAFTTEDPASQLPPATGWGVLRVSSTGLATIAAKTPDGTSLIGAAGVSPTGVLIFNSYANLHHTHVAGSLQFADLSKSDLTGTLEWTNEALVSANGVHQTIVGGAPLMVQGSRIQLLTARQEPLSGTTQPVQATFLVAEPAVLGTDIPMTLQGRLGTPNVPGVSALLFQSNSYGCFSGSLKANGTTMPFDGVFLPKAQAGFGRFSGLTGMSSISVTPPAP